MTHSVNFISVLLTALALVDSESVRTQSSRQYLLTLLASTSVKAVRRMLMKSTHSVPMIVALVSACAHVIALGACMGLNFQVKIEILGIYRKVYGIRN